MLKKISLTLSLLILMLAMAACAQEPAQSTLDPVLSGTLDEIIAYVYENTDADQDVKDWLGTHLRTEVTEENAEYMIGSAAIDFKEALASEPMMSAQAFSVVVLRMNEGADVEAAKAEIKEKVNPRKWICVGVTDENVIVDSLGDIVILIMADNAKSYQEAFQKLSNN